MARRCVGRSALGVCEATPIYLVDGVPVCGRHLSWFVRAMLEPGTELPALDQVTVTKIMERP